MRRDGLSFFRKRPGMNRISVSVMILIRTDHRPVILPGDRLKMTDAAIESAVLEVQEPLSSIGGIDQTALMGTVDDGITLFHDCPDFIRAMDILTAQRDLPAAGYPACRGKNVIVSVAPVHFRSFDGDRRMRRIIAVKDELIFRDRLHAVRRHLKDSKDGLEADPASCICMNDIGTAVFIPIRARIDESLCGTYADRLGPGAKRVLCGDHIDAFIRHAVVDIVQPVMITDGRCPDTFGMARDFKPLSDGFAVLMRAALCAVFFDLFDRIGFQFPVDKVFGNQNRQTRHIVETRSRQNIRISHTDHIRVGIVRKQNRIFKISHKS